MALIGPATVLYGLTVACAALWFGRPVVLAPAVLIVVFGLLYDFEG